MSFSEQSIQQQPCYSNAKHIKLDHGVTKTITLELRDSSGNLVDISADNIEAVFVVKTVAAASGALWELDCTKSTDTGVVTVDCTYTDVTSRAGIFLANVLVYTDEKLTDVFPFYLEITANTITRTTAPVSISDIRMELMDTCPDMNYLIDELEFTDQEILFAINKAVDIFNEVPPPVGGFSVDAFPYRGHLITAAAGYLMIMASKRYLRNSLQYSAAGVTVADKEKYMQYMQIGQQHVEEWKQFARVKKVELNVANCFGTYGSRYRFH